MAIIYEYRCERCAQEWALFSTFVELGPIQWGKLDYTCFSCQTFLAIAAAVDSNSWSIWYRNHQAKIQRNTTLQALADSISARFLKSNRLLPIELTFANVECPTCHAEMSTVPFGQHAMRCPACSEFAGKSDFSHGVSTYSEEVT